jgi:glutathione reductase (NADPH)
MSTFDFDLVVIGGGSGGVRAARVAAELGAKVALIESSQLGGTCVNLGCIPKKLLVYAAEFGHAWDEAAGYGFRVSEPTFDWATLVQRKNVEIARLNRAYEGLLHQAGVELIRGRAALIDPHTAQVAGRLLRSRYLLIATGGVPDLPRVAGRQHAITSDEAFHLPSLPQRVMLVGGGYIALEFASIFEGLGREVEVLHRGDQILRGFDRDVRDHLASELRKQGIAVRCCTSVRSIERRGHELDVKLENGESTSCDLLLFATGRVPNTADLGLERAGVALDGRGAVKADRLGRSSVPHIFAVGDVVGRFGLTPVAIAQGHAVARTLFAGGGPVEPDLEHVPTAVFSQPPVAVVGLPEHDARAQYQRIATYRSVFTPLKHRLTGRDRQSLVKLVVDDDSDRVLGCHMVGADAPEIIQGFAVALKVGATKAQFDSVIGLHPSAAEEFVTLRKRSDAPA